jgi:hypothetical protein
VLGYYDEAERREHIQRKSDQKKEGKIKKMTNRFL